MYVNRANVVVILDMSVVYAINCPAMHAVLSMVNVKTVHAFAHKAGMDDIAHYVSFVHILFYLTECEPFVLTLSFLECGVDSQKQQQVKTLSLLVYSRKAKKLRQQTFHIFNAFVVLLCEFTIEYM